MILTAGVFILGTGFGALLALALAASSRRRKQWDRILYKIEHQLEGLRQDMNRLAQRQ